MEKPSILGRRVALAKATNCDPERVKLGDEHYWRIRQNQYISAIEQAIKLGWLFIPGGNNDRN